MSTIVYLCDWLPPDFGAVGQYSLGFSKDLAQQKHRVVLVGLSSEQASLDEQHSAGGRLIIKRVYAKKYDKTRLLKRAIWTLFTNIRLLMAAGRYLRTCDRVIFTGSPPYMIHFIAPLNLLLRKQLVYRITDFHPECLIANYEKVPIGLRVLQKLTWFWRRRVSQFEVLGYDQQKKLEDAGIASAKITLKRDPSPVTFDSAIPMAIPEKLAGKGVILYSGNWGLAHDTDTFCQGFQRFSEHHGQPLGFWLNACGERADQVHRYMDTHSLPLHRSQLVPLAELPNLLVSPDLHLISLRDAYVGYVLPCKVYACIESAKPVLFIGSEESDVHKLCTERMESRYYRQVNVGDSDGVKKALEYFYVNVIGSSLKPPTWVEGKHQLNEDSS